MLASAVRTYLNRFGVAPAGRAVIATNNDTAYATAFDLAAQGIEVIVADSREAIAADLKGRNSIEILTGTSVVDVKGKDTLHAVLSGAEERTITCDVVAVSGGWSPVVHLTSHGGIKPRYDAGVIGFVPGGSHRATTAPAPSSARSA